MKTDEEPHLSLQADTIRAFVVDACGGDRKIVLQMVDFFLHSADNLHGDIAGGVATGDFAAARRAAHSLKSSSRMFSAEELAMLCAEAEGLAEDAQGDAIALLLPRMRTELNWLGDELAAFCTRMLQ